MSSIIHLPDRGTTAQWFEFFRGPTTGCNAIVNRYELTIALHWNLCKFRLTGKIGLAFSCSVCGIQTFKGMIGHFREASNSKLAYQPPFRASLKPRLLHMNAQRQSRFCKAAREMTLNYHMPQTTCNNNKCK